ncbi:sigma-54-dependent transcriptional regulator [Acinetobacter pollinis]|uniref:Sigma-54-dependent Fis family transcriptional regulator n=1 Tax=Acinetobacter pollinis TaxID=2605270 RepID=A0ABU6DTQ1_9GAMM|nr:sigma-54 dependent transcriptional regulator [Acinetobacter pollinis]MEB5476768.1 sigma-54-dependent Fis family transcriptional regulator [Acinetobacter pollinis]
MTINNPKILFVDDEVDLCMLIQMSLKRIHIYCDIAHDVAQAKEKLSKHKYDACLTDLNLPDESGLELVKYVTDHYHDLPIAVLSAYGNMEIAIAALKAGAFDFLSKPINLESLKNLLEKAFSNKAAEQKLNSSDIEYKLLIGQSPVMNTLRDTLRKVAKTQAPVFIMGESGTGKEVIAKLVHLLSHRKESTFVPINCGAIPADLMESELFGYVKGSFTGATQNKVGLIQSADGGTLFLDEIAELPMNMQVKLLRAVQEKCIRPIGSDTEIPVDFRIISATHQNVEQLIQEGKFRQDLFFRLHVMDIQLPPLRERGADIILLAKHFLEKICTEWQIPTKEFTISAKDWLMKQRYTGNIRELRNIIERAITLSDGHAISDINLKSINIHKPTPQVETPPQPISTPVISPTAYTDDSTQIEMQKVWADGLEPYLEAIEKRILIETLNKTYWNRTQAAKKLNMSFRSLRYRLKKFGLDEG